MGMNAEVMASSGHSECQGSRGAEVHVQQGLSVICATVWQTDTAEIQ